MAGDRFQLGVFGESVGLPPFPGLVPRRHHPESAARSRTTQQLGRLRSTYSESLGCSGSLVILRLLVDRIRHQAPWRSSASNLAKSDTSGYASPIQPGSPAPTDNRCHRCFRQSPVLLLREPYARANSTGPIAPASRRDQRHRFSPCCISSAWCSSGSPSRPTRRSPAYGWLTHPFGTGFASR